MRGKKTKTSQSSSMNTTTSSRRRLYWYTFLLITTSLTLFMSDLSQRSLFASTATTATTTTKNNNNNNNNIDDYEISLPTTIASTVKRTTNNNIIQYDNTTNNNTTGKMIENDTSTNLMIKTSNLESSNYHTDSDIFPPVQKENNGAVSSKGKMSNNSTLTQTDIQQNKPIISSNSNTDTTSHNEQKPTAWICWVGVDEDWEEENVDHSFEYIIQPLDDAGYEIKLGIFLQIGRKDHVFPPFREPYSFSDRYSKYDGESSYINTTFPFNQRANALYTKHRYSAHRKFEIPYGEPKNITSILSPYFNNLHHSKYDEGMVVHIDHYNPLVNPPTPIDYLHATSLHDGIIHKKKEGGALLKPATTPLKSKVSEMLIAKNKQLPQQLLSTSSEEPQISRKSFERTVWRVVNHVRDMHSHFLCGRWLKKMRQHQTNKSNNRPNNTHHNDDQDDLIIRLGEDTRLWNPLNVSYIQNELKPNQVLTIQGYTSRGHDNDQVEIYKDRSPTQGNNNIDDRIHVALMKAYPGMYQHDVFQGRRNGGGMIKTLADYLRLIHESLGFEVLVLPQRSKSLTTRRKSKTTTTTTPWTKLPPLAMVLPFNFSSVKLPVPYPLSKRDFIGFTNETEIEAFVAVPASNETASRTSNGVPIAPVAPPIATADKNEKKKSILVCITGQQERLELENKIKTLLKPMSDEYEMDIVVVLQGGQALFQRRKKQSVAELKREAPIFATPDDVYKYLTTRSVDLTFANVSVRTYQPPIGFPINPQFLAQKGFGLGFQDKKNQYMKAKRLDIVTERIAANLKMMQAYQMCYSKHDKEYDLYLRIRDDAGFRREVPPENYSPILNYTEAFLVPSRLGNGGINDRLAFVTGHQSALCYFHLPFVQMFSSYKLDHAMANTESYFKRLYWIHECPKTRAFPTKKNKLDPIKMFQGKFLEH